MVETSITSPSVTTNITSSPDKLIQEFIARDNTCVFSVAGKVNNASSYGDGVMHRLRSPYLIRQQGASLCGPAAFFSILAKDKPLVYTRYSIDLYEKGEAQLGSLRIKPGKRIRNFDLSKAKISALDWITLGSLRDSSNTLFDFDGIEGTMNQFSGITLPFDMTKWFKSCGYTNVANNTNLIFDKDLSILEKANALYSSGARVCLLVGNRAFRNERGGV